jgi:diguanylate cyclase (GGDEF)-like protein
LFTDITLRKISENTLQHLAHHDTLTGLPNRTLFFDRLNQAIAQADRTKDIIAVLFVDLDHFKPINDTFGHATGDQLLKQVSQRIQKCIRKGDTLARIGGDEFVVILNGRNRQPKCAKNRLKNSKLALKTISTSTQTRKVLLPPASASACIRSMGKKQRSYFRLRIKPCTGQKTSG